MSFKIKDRFTDLPVSRQRKYQLRKNASGLCERCHRRAVKWGLCKIHVVAKRQERRKLHGCEKQYDCSTLDLEAKIKAAAAVKARKLSRPHNSQPVPPTDPSP